MHKTTRREFIEESMIATAAALVAGTPRPSAEAADTQPQSANETIRHAIIGCRIRGRVHAKEFSGKYNVETAYVCDPDSQLANELADAVESHQGRRPKVVQDLRVIYDDQAIDTVSIAAPNHWHALAAIWAMQAGKHAYVEKPVSHDVAEGRRIVQVARKTGKICQTGTQNRSRGDLAEAARFIREGKLGKVTLARSIVYGRRNSIGKRGPCEIPPQVDVNLWLGPGTQQKLMRPTFHYDWHWFWDTGNGELGNNNIHYVDLCRWLTGLDGLGNSVISVGGRLGYEDAGETPNTQLVVHTFPEVTIIQEVRGLKSDPFSKTYKAGYVIHGTEGFIADACLFDGDGKLVQKFEGPDQNHFENFIKAVRSGRRDELNAEILEGHQSTSLCHIGNISYRLGRADSPEAIRRELEHHHLHEQAADALARMLSHLQSNGVDLKQTPLTIGPLLHMDAKKEAFVGNPEADRLLAREYRKPFVVPAETEI